MTRSHLVLSGLVLALAACDRSPKPAPAPAAAERPSGSGLAAPTGFTHEDKVDIAGNFVPKEAVQSGVFRLTRMAAGKPDDFHNWEKGERVTGAAPLMMAFEDVNSPLQADERGQEHRTVLIHVLPLAYHVTKAAIAFHGQDSSLGAVTFAGAFNQRALAQAKASGQVGEASVLKGDLQVGGQRFRDVAFSYASGD